MPKIRAVVVLAAVAAVAGVAPRARQASPPPSTVKSAADTLVPGPPNAIVLLKPATPYLAAVAAERVLKVAGIRYGLEVPALDPAAPPIDLATLSDRSIPLAGGRVRDALDAIAKAAPAIQWTEEDGLVVVRSVPDGEGLLDRRVLLYAVTDAGPRAALEALIQAIDAARPKGVGIMGFGRPGGGAMMAGSTPAGKNVTVTLGNTTVRAVFQAIARQNGALSWTVRYDAAPATYDSAAITFSESGETVTAASPVSLRATSDAAPGNGRGMPMPPGTRISISPQLSSMITAYAAQTGARVSMEELAPPMQGPIPGLPLGVPALGLPPIDVSGVGAATALARLVALDSRYELSEARGRFLVRPKPGTPGRLTLLDQPIGAFSASNEPAGSVIDRIAAHLGTVPRPIGMTGPPGRTSPITTAMQVPISVNLSGGDTIRDALNAVSDATGWTWVFRPQFSAGSGTTLQIQWRGENWGTSTQVRIAEDLSPSPRPARPPARTVPETLDRTIPRLSLRTDPPGGAGLIDLLGRLAHAPVGIEMPPSPAQSRDSRVMTRPQQPVIVGPGKFSDALYVLLEKDPDYQIVSTDAVVTVAPKSLVDDPGYFMNRPIERFVVQQEGLYHAIGSLRHAINPQYVPRDWTGAGATTMNRPVTLSTTRATPRAILSQIVGQHGGLMWSSSFEGATVFDPAKAQEADWVVTLVPIDDSGTPVRLGPMRDAAPEVAPPTAPARGMPLAGRPAGPPVQLDLPASPDRTRFTLSQLGRTFHQPMGVEVVVSSAGPSLPAAQYYDLTGLSLEESLDKIGSFLPDYTIAADRGVVHMQPKALVADPANWLNQRVDRFEQHFDNVRDALYAVAGLVVRPSRAGAPPGPVPPPGIGLAAPPPGSGMSDALTARLVTSLTISLTNVTVRDVLDEIARKHGAMSWFVEHRTVASGQAVMLTFQGYDGWSIGTSVR